MASSLPISTSFLAALARLKGLRSSLVGMAQARKGEGNGSRRKPNAFTPVLLLGAIGGLLLGVVTGLIAGDVGRWLIPGLGFGIVVAAVVFIATARKK
jgi:hypothetical protein